MAMVGVLPVCQRRANALGAALLDQEEGRDALEGTLSLGEGGSVWHPCPPLAPKPGLVWGRVELHMG